MPEVSEADLAVMQRGMALLRTMENDPRSKPHLEAAVKIHHPDVRTETETVHAAVEPILAPINDTLAKIQEQLTAQADERKASAESAADANLTAAFTRLQTQGGYTDDGITKIKEMMVEKKIADPEAAAALFDKQNPKPPTEAPSWQPDGWDMAATPGSGGQRDMDGLFANEDKWADQEAAIVLNEIRLGKAA